MLGGLPVDWRDLQRHFRLKSQRYPSNAQLLHYYRETFSVHTSSSERSKWHRMDKLLLLWVAAKHCELNGRSIARL